MAQGDEWLSILAASKVAGCSRERLLRLVGTGELGGLRIAGRTVIKQSELDELIARDRARQLQSA
jgi:hypothetical protein